MLRRWFSRRNAPDEALRDAAYGQIVAAARQKALYAVWDAPDTPLGRFEMLSLHMILALRRLSGQGEVAEGLAASLADLFFSETDRALRDLGVGDGRVPKTLKAMAEMFYGRAKAYGDAIGAGDGAALAAALRRNVRPDGAEWPEAEALARHALAVDAAFAHMSKEDIAAGRFDFPPPHQGKTT